MPSKPYTCPGPTCRRATRRKSGLCEICDPVTTRGHNVQRDAPERDGRKAGVPNKASEVQRLEKRKRRHKALYSEVTTIPESEYNPGPFSNPWEDATLWLPHQADHHPFTLFGDPGDLLTETLLTAYALSHRRRKIRLEAAQGSASAGDSGDVAASAPAAPNLEPNRALSFRK